MEQQIIEFLSQNWGWIAVLILTELLPFLPTEANGIVQGIIAIIKRIGKGGAAIVMILTFTGCATCNITPVIAVGDNNKPSVRTTDNDTPTTKVETTASIPIK